MCTSSVLFIFHLESSLFALQQLGIHAIDPHLPRHFVLPSFVSSCSVCLAQTADDTNANESRLERRKGILFSPLCSFIATGIMLKQGSEKSHKRLKIYCLNRIEFFLLASFISLPISFMTKLLPLNFEFLSALLGSVFFVPLCASLETVFRVSVHATRATSGEKNL